MINIRQAVTRADIALARTLFSEYADSLGIDLAFQDFDTERANLPGDYTPPGGALLLAELGGEVVGCAALRPLEPPRIAELKRLFVRPSGRGHGLGEALSRSIIELARTAGYVRIRLDTLPSMGTAQALYHRLGFHEIPAYRLNPVPGAKFMELDLERPRGTTPSEGGG